MAMFPINLNKKNYCVLHILSSSYLHCHIGHSFNDLSKRSIFLLGPGYGYGYDSLSRMFVLESAEDLLETVKRALDSVYNYQERSLNEFEIVEFRKEMVPEEYWWREFDA